MRPLVALATVMLTSAVLSAQGVYTLRADGSADTYGLIQKSGFFAETSGKQTPDDFMCHSSFHHISQVADPVLGRYAFAFDIHVDFEEGTLKITDGNKSELVDRQRNEIKCMSSVPATVAADGETIRYRWKFKLPEGMKTTSEFCHIHQIKGMGDGAEVAHPVFTFTCRSVSSKQVLQIINVPYEGSPNVNLAQIDLVPLLGKWIEAEEYVTVGHHGSYILTLTDIESNRMVAMVNEPDIEVWRYTTDNSTMRGKWGIYRSLGTDLRLKSQLRSERVLFADFEAEKVTSPEAGIESISGDQPTSGDETIYDLTGRRVTDPAPGIYIKNGKKIIIK